MSITILFPFLPAMVKVRWNYDYSAKFKEMSAGYVIMEKEAWFLSSLKIGNLTPMKNVCFVLDV